MLCEKPFTSRAADAEAAFAAAERAGRVLMEGLMWRFHPQAAVLARLARELRPRSCARCSGSICRTGPTCAGAPSSAAGR